MNAKERTAFLLEMGICTRCGKALAAEGRNSCPNCLDNFKIIYEQRKAKGDLYYQQNAEKIKKQHKERYEDLKRQGLCVMCGKKAVEGLTICQMCRNKKNERATARKHAELCRASG